VRHVRRALPAAEDVILDVCEREQGIRASIAVAVVIVQLGLNALEAGPYLAAEFHAVVARLDQFAPDRRLLGLDGCQPAGRAGRDVAL